jgi:hypothetical protein
VKILTRVTAALVGILVVLGLSIAPASAASANLQFTSTQTQGYVGNTYTPTTSSNSPEPVTITVSPYSFGACTISGGVVTFVHSGYCTINATQPAGSGYDAGSAWQTLSVSDAAATNLHFTSGGVFGSWTTYTPTAASSSPATIVFSIDAGSTPGACSLSGGVVTADHSHPGTCTIDADQAPSGQYAAGHVSLSLAVS